MADALTDVAKASTDIPLTRAGREVLDRAAAIAAARGAAQTDPLDVLKATLESRSTLAEQAVRALNADPASLSAQLPAPDGSAGLPVRQLLVNANREAQVLGHYQVDPIHLLLAMLYSDSPGTSAALQGAGLTLYDLRRHLQAAPKPAVSTEGRSGPRPDAALRRKPLPSLRGATSVSPIFLALVAVTAGSGALLWFNVLPAGVVLMTIIFVTAGWITSLCVHEFGHALVAYLGGDRSVAAYGYLSLNPLRYTNLLLSVVMPVAFLLLGGIGLPGGAVYINHSAIRSKRWDSAVSVAGPAGTLLCGLLVAVPFLVLNHELWFSHLTFFAGLAFLGFIEAIALVLNLLPIPGLDGFGIIRPWLPYSVQDMAVRYGQMAIIGVFIVLWFVAPVSHAFFQAVLQLTSLVGIDPYFIAAGQSDMRFR
ncbi:MAG TPA: Clp protease N-terminal domain-containing protein [Candidatus Dormibacteraeota bacterium]